MAKVYVLFHDNRIYGEGSVELRGIFADQQSAEASIQTITPDIGEPTRSFWAHTENCCSVEEFEVQTEAQYDYRENDPPIDPKSSEGKMMALAARVMDQVVEDTLRRPTIMDRVIYGMWEDPNPVIVPRVDVGSFPDSPAVGPE